MPMTGRVKADPSNARPDAVSANSGARADEAFLSLLSHELRSPLNAMVGWLQVLRSPNSNALTSARALEGLDSAVQRQCRLAEQLLDAIQIFSPRFRLEQSPIALAPLVAQVIDKIWASADVKSILLPVTQINPMLMVSVEPVRLAEALSYILQSVILRTGKDGLIEVSARLHDHQVCIEIKDGNRAAIAVDLSPSPTPANPSDDLNLGRYLGPGLGLSLAKALVELHGGTLDLSLPVDGSPASVVLKLPAVLNTMKDRRPVEPLIDLVSSEASQELPLAGTAVLVLRDGLACIDEACRHLREFGAYVTAIDTRESALEHYSQWAKWGGERLMLWPLAVNEPSSVAAISRIRQIELEFSLPRIPVIALATDAKPDGSKASARRELLSAGFDLELRLPIAPTTLLAALAPLLGR
jgi:hypothetical protein